MKFANVNDHLVQIPKNVSVVSEGEWDCLEYKDLLLYTVEEGNTSIEGVYEGPFYLTVFNDTREFENIEAAIEFIDQLN
jgi:hypothetical protein